MRLLNLAPTRRSALAYPLFYAFVFLLSACSGGAPDEAALELPAEPKTSGDELAAAPSIPRFQLIRVIEGGLGRVLQHLELEPHRVDGEFRGFRVLHSRLMSLAGHRIDLRDGDVILSLNGRSVERPEQAMEAFEALRGESAIVVSLLRGERREELRIPIVD